MALALFFRSLGALVLLPLTGSSRSLLRSIAIAALLSVLLCNETPHLLSGIKLWESARVAGLNFLLGLLLALPLILSARVAGMLGDLFDLWRGQSLGQMYDPVNAAQSGFSSLLLSNWAWAMILSMGGIEQLLVGIDGTSRLLGAGRTVGSEVLSRVSLGFVAETVGGSCSLFACCIALPIVSEIILASLTRIVPQLNYQNFSFLLRSAFGMLVAVAIIQSDSAVKWLRGAAIDGVQRVLVSWGGANGAR